MLQTSSTTNQTVILESGQSNFSSLIRSKESSLIPKTDKAAIWISEGLQTMIASEAILAKDWNTPEEDAAWANL